MTTERQTLINDIKSVSSDLESLPSKSVYNEVQQKDNDLSPTYRIVEEFGSWNKALKCCGFRQTNPPNKNEIRAAVKRVNGEVNGNLTFQKYQSNRKESEPSQHQIYRHFDSWATLLENLGIDKSKYQNMNFTTDDCIKSIQRVAEELGGNISQDKYEYHSRDNEPSVTTISNLLVGKKLGEKRDFQCLKNISI